MGLLAYSIGGLPGSASAAYELLRDRERRDLERAELAARDTPEYRARAEAAQQRAYARMDSGIRRAAIRVVKARARAYRDMPGQLEMVSRGLSYATAPALIEFGTKRLAAERAQGLSGADLIVPVQAANARAVILVGRYLRRFESRTQMQEAAE